MDISGKAAIVTGGASGLGLATVRKLALEGAKVVILDLPSSEGRKVAQELGAGAVFVAADVTDPDQVQAAVDAAIGLGQLAVAVNCAGIGNAFRVVGKDGPFPLDGFRKVIEVNLIGTFNVIRLAAAAMIAQSAEGEERGVIINTASVAAFDGQIGVRWSDRPGGVLRVKRGDRRDDAAYRARSRPAPDPGEHHRSRAVPDPAVPADER